MCNAFQIKYTVKHILIECIDLDHIMKTFYSANNMKELFKNTEINNVISFLKSVKMLYGWFNKGIPQVQAEELASLSESD